MSDEKKPSGNAIVRPPSPNFSQGLTTVQLGQPAYTRAVEQHEAYCAALQQSGPALLSLEADARYPDSAFVEDTAVLTERCAMLARPGAPSRVGEVLGIATVLAQYYSALHSIREPG